MNELMLMNGLWLQHAAVAWFAAWSWWLDQAEPAWRPA